MSIHRAFNGLSPIRALVWVLLALLVSNLSGGLRAATNYGPNILPNSSFEGGSEVWYPIGPFTIIKSPLNAHSGSWTLKATLSANPTNENCYQTATVWPNTDYVSTVWIKGKGSLEFGVTDGTGSITIASVHVTAAAKWQQITLPWNSGSYSSVWIYLRDSVAGNTGSIAYLDDCQTCLANGGDIHFNPAKPAASGYTLMFDDEFTTAKTVDIDHTGATGYYWYVGQYFSQFFNYPQTPSSMYSLGAGMLSILNNPPQTGMTVHTAEPDAVNPLGFHGTVFSGGQGIYIEAQIALPNTGLITNSYWPSFWTEDLKAETLTNEEMPGNPGYSETIEDDIMEYNPNWGNGNAYISVVHDFSDQDNTNNDYNLTNDNQALPVPVGTNYATWHRYGVLWVPASSANGWIGYRQAFFDGVAEAAVCWQGNQAPTFPPSGSYLFSLKDQDQFDLIFGGCETGLPSLRVNYVHVYAVSPSSVTVVPAGLPGTVYPTSTVSVARYRSVKLTFPGLPGNPPGATYVWYLYGIKLATTTIPSYTILDAQVAKAGTYTVFASAPGTPANITGSASFVVTISN